MRGPASRNEQIRAMFDRTQLYLRKDFGISIRASVVRELLGEIDHSRILDLGCGDGRISLQYLSPTNSITLVDLSAKMLDIARGNTPAALRARVDYVQADLQGYEAAERFDIVLCIGVLAHVASMEDTIAKAASLLNAGGRCILQLTDADRSVGRFLGALGRLRSALGRLRRYTLNETRLSAISDIAAANRLTLLGRRQYWPALPGMGRMPNQWLWRYQMCTLTHEALSRRGPELILLYAKAH